MEGAVRSGYLAAEALSRAAVMPPTPTSWPPIFPLPDLCASSVPLNPEVPCLES